ncbi:MAG TPA: hypothetical protein VIL55_02875 [Naasia sp.]|jgi:hypothetical protein
MPTTGEPVPLTLTVGGADTDTEVSAVAVGPLGGSELDLAVLLDAPPDRSRWASTLVPTMPGEWRVQWTVTGSGAGVAWDTVLVQAAPGDVPTGGRSYATTVDLARWPGTRLFAGAGAALAEASRALDAVLIGAWYATDEDGQPTDPRVRAALRDAVCAQVAYWQELGDDTGSGAAEQWASIGIGSVQLSRASRSQTGGQDPQPDIDAPAALRILRNAGLLPIRPVVYG